MTDFLSLHDAEQIAAEEAPVPKPGLSHVATGVIRNPAQTLADALAHPFESYALTLAAAGGVYWALNVAIAEAGSRTASLPVSLAAIVFLGICGGVAYLYALTILLNWSCDILGGQATRKKLRTVLAYAGVPGIIALVLFGLPKLLIYGQSLFMQERSSISSPFIWVLWFGDALCFAWSLMLVVKGLKMMNGFGTAKAMMAALLPLGPIALIGILFAAVVWGGGSFAPPAY